MSFLELKVIFVRDEEAVGSNPAAPTIWLKAPTLGNRRHGRLHPRRTFCQESLPTTVSVIVDTHAWNNHKCLHFVRNDVCRGETRSGHLVSGCLADRIWRVSRQRHPVAVHGVVLSTARFGGSRLGVAPILLSAMEQGLDRDRDLHRCAVGHWYGIRDSAVFLSIFTPTTEPTAAKWTQAGRGLSAARSVDGDPETGEFRRGSASSATF